MANTTAQLSEIAVANMAAAVLSEGAITSLDDNSSLGRFMAREFGFSRDEVLQSYPWHFARSRALLPKLTAAPAFGYSNKFQLPEDCVRLLPITEAGVWGGVPVVYELESREILTNYQWTGGTLPVYFIRRETNLARWSPLAARVLAARLAMTAAMRITAKPAYFDRIKTAYADAVYEAHLADSLERGTPEHSYGDTVLSVRVPS